jgi:hypothetical protein
MLKSSARSPDIFRPSEPSFRNARLVADRRGGYCRGGAWGDRADDVGRIVKPATRDFSSEPLVEEIEVSVAEAVFAPR